MPYKQRVRGSNPCAPTREAIITRWSLFSYRPVAMACCSGGGGQSGAGWPAPQGGAQHGSNPRPTMEKQTGGVSRTRLLLSAV